MLPAGEPAHLSASPGRTYEKTQDLKRPEREATMSARLVTAALALAAMMTMRPGAADAAPYWPWCSRYFERDAGGLYQCAFASWEQCMETVRGIGGVCYMNPYPKPNTATPSRPAKSRRHAARN
jgi:hypothetical protein